MLSSLGLGPQPTLKLTLLEELLFLHPGPPGEPTEDPWVAGSVTLFLPKPRIVRELRVRLLGTQDIHWPGVRPMESTNCIDKDVTLCDELGDVPLEKGEHTFEFQILVPSSTPPYEKSQYGRVRHTVTATAKGLGKSGGDLVEEKVLYLVPNPAGPGASRPPPPLHLKHGSFSEDVGVSFVYCTPPIESQANRQVAALLAGAQVPIHHGRLSSNDFQHGQGVSLTQAPARQVGGLLFLRFAVLSPPTDLTILSLKVRINQHFTLKSSIEADFIIEPPVDRRTVIDINSTNPANQGILSQSHARREKKDTPLVVVPAGTTQKFAHLARLPGDEYLRPSTIAGVNAGIAVRDDISVEINYHVGPPINLKSKGKAKASEVRRLTITKPLDMFSCCCLIASLTLPIYSEFDPDPNPFFYVPPCVCGMPDSLLANKHQEALLREEDEPGGVERHKVI